MTKTEKDLGKIESEIGKTSFLNGKGLGNEVSYYVFDYDPKDEILVREYIDKLVTKDKEFGDGYKLKVYDVYDLMIELLESEGYLEDCFEMEKNDGMNYLVESVNDLLRMNDDSNYFAEYNGQSLELFGEFKDDNYDRAFPLIK